MDKPIKENRLKTEEKSIVESPKNDACQESGGDKKSRTAVNLSVIGLILSVFGGVGIFFSVAGVICGMLKKDIDPLSSRFAILLGSLGAVLALIFAGMLVWCLSIVF